MKTIGDMNWGWKKEIFNTIYGLIIFVCATLMISCEEKEKSRYESPNCLILNDTALSFCHSDIYHYVKLDNNNILSYTIVEIDGCEYIATRTWMGANSLTHKGNCKNPVHQK